MRLGVRTTIRDDAIGMAGELTLAEFLVELVVRVDGERLLESLEGVALRVEYLHDGTGARVGVRHYPFRHASELVNEVCSTCQVSLLLAKCTRISIKLSCRVGNPIPISLAGGVRLRGGRELCLTRR